MTHMLEGWLKGAMEKADRERALKEVFEASLWDQATAFTTVVSRATEVEKA